MKDNASMKLLAVFIAAVMVVSAVPSAIGEIENETLYQSSISVPSTIKVLMLNGSVVTMNLDEYLKGVVSAEMSQIIVEDADTIWNTTTAYSSDLTEVASNVTPRILTEYANSIYHNALDEIPAELANLTKEVPAKRLIIEYATSTWSTSLSPPPFIKPEVRVSTDKYEYTADETMSINITLSNPTEVGQPVYFAWRLDLPDYDLQYWIMIEELYLPPDYEQTFTIPFTLGDYGIPFNASWYVALANTATYEIISEDTADWIYSFTTQDLGVKAANLAKQVVGTPYLWGGKGWNWNPEGGWKWEEGQFVKPENGYPSIKGGYYYYSPTMGEVEFGKGLDCSGLSFWAFNKAAATSEYPPGKPLDYECPVYYEGAHGQWTDNERLLQLPKDTPIDKLKPGDLLFFDTDKNGQMDHVIMYVGNGDVVHAEGVIYDKIVEEKLDTVLERYTDYFGGYGRVKTVPMGRIMPEEIAKELKGALEEMEKEADKEFLKIGGDKR